MSCPSVSFWSLFPDIPDQFESLLLVLAVIFALTPYFAGADFGPIKIPKLSQLATRRLKILGPLGFAIVLLLFAPLLPPENISPTHTVATSAGLVNLRTAPLTQRELIAGEEESLETGVPHATIIRPLLDGTEVQLMQQVSKFWHLVQVYADCSIQEGYIATKWKNTPTLIPIP